MIMEKKFASRDQYSNDLFWNFYTPTEFSHKKNGECKMIDGEGLKWTGYNDRNWWENVATQPGYNQQKDSRGRIWQINFRTNEVKLLKKPKVAAPPTNLK